jgi:hypothetical protein
VSFRDASLSAPASWPGALGIEPGVPPGAGVLATEPGSELLLAAVTHDAAQPGTGRRIAARDSSGGRDEAEHGNVRRGRARTLLATRSSTPPISGHGAPNCAEGGALRPNRSSRRLRVAALGLRLFGGPVASTPAPPLQANSSPVNGDGAYRGLAIFTVWTRILVPVDSTGKRFTSACMMGCVHRL